MKKKGTTKTVGQAAGPAKGGVHGHAHTKRVGQAASKSGK